MADNVESLDTIEVAGTKFINVRVNEVLWRRVKGLAGTLGIPTWRWVERALEASIEKQVGAAGKGVDLARIPVGPSTGVTKTRGRRPALSPGSNAEAFQAGTEEAIHEGSVVPSRGLVLPKGNGPVRMQGEGVGAADPWAAKCSRSSCGHSKRLHLHKGELARCEKCSCPGFEQEG